MQLQVLETTNRFPTDFLLACKLDISDPLATGAVLGVAPRFCHVSSETLSDVKKKIAL